jgi:hypothetical protein
LSAGKDASVIALDQVHDAGLEALERNLLGFVGIVPIHETPIGCVKALRTIGAAGGCASSRISARPAPKHAAEKD